jgi:hypothetical protein
MDDSPRKKPWWTLATAAVLAVATLYYFTGSWAVVVLFLAGAGALIAYQGRGGTAASHACVRCGAKLNPNARQCDACGSASWTVRN